MKNNFKNKSWQGLAAVVKQRKDYKFGPASSSDLWRLVQKNFTEALGKKKQARVLVLGATPEFRDLAIKKGCQVVVLDQSMAMITKMSSLMKYQNNPNETIITSNWLSSPVRDSFFDVIVGDFVAFNIPSKFLEIFFSELKRMLKKDGYIFLRELYIMPEIKKRKAEEIIELYRIEHWDVGCRNPRSGHIKREVIFEKMTELYKEKKLNKSEYDMLQKMRCSGSAYVLSKELFFKKFTKYFKLLNVDYAKGLRYFEFAGLILGKKE